MANGHGSGEVPPELQKEVESALKAADDSPEAILRDIFDGFKALNEAEARDSYIQTIEKDLENDEKGLLTLSDNVRAAYQNFLKMIEAPAGSIRKAEDEALDMYKRLHGTAPGNAYYEKCLKLIRSDADTEEMARAKKFIELYEEGDSSEEIE